MLAHHFVGRNNLRLDFVVVVVPSNEVKGNRKIFSKEWVEQLWIVFAFPDFRIKRITEDADS